MRWGATFDVSQKQSRLEELEKIITEPDFWNDNERAQKLVKERGSLNEQIDSAENLVAAFEDIDALFELYREDPELEPELIEELSRVEVQISEFELGKMLCGKHDSSDAIVEINAGAGGTDAQDWAEMLMRMYLRWAEKKGYRTKVLSISAGEEAGIKNTTLVVEGENAFGYLRSERGVHRLVRISPFKSNASRQTSFASVVIVPDIEEDVEIEISEEDLRVDTFRASGAGGQHVNTTDSAVRITHAPSGIVVSCQNERSQHKNKATAMKLLRAKLYEEQREKQREEINKLAGERKKIDFGSQIRSYVMQPYQMVKDLRTNAEVGDVQAVLDGDLEKFIEAYLLSEEHNVVEV